MTFLVLLLFRYCFFFVSRNSKPISIYIHELVSCINNSLTRSLKCKCNATQQYVSVGGAISFQLCKQWPILNTIQMLRQYKTPNGQMSMSLMTRTPSKMPLTSFISQKNVFDILRPNFQWKTEKNMNKIKDKFCILNDKSYVK